MNHSIHLLLSAQFLVARGTRINGCTAWPSFYWNESIDSTRLYSIDNGTPANGAEQRLFWGGGSTGTYDVTVSTQYLGWLLLSEEE
jgi:hypothetical protein